MPTIREEIVGLKVLLETHVMGELSKLHKGQQAVLEKFQSLDKASHVAPCAVVQDVKAGADTAHRRIDSWQKAYIFSGILAVLVVLVGIFWGIRKVTNDDRISNHATKNYTSPGGK